MAAFPTFACTLDAAGLRDRAAQVARLAGRLRARTVAAGRVRLTFDADAKAEVRRFVADESTCCSFFAFDVAHDQATHDAEVVLTITAPEGADELLEPLVEGFDPDLAVADRVAAFTRSWSPPPTPT